MRKGWNAASLGLACAGVLVFCLAEASDASAKGKRVRRGKQVKNLSVVLITPTNNQEVLPDLSDPGLNGVVTIRFSSRPRRKDIIDNQNVVNRLRTRVQFLDTNFGSLGGTPRVRGRVFTFNPKTIANNGVLAHGQYTLTLKSTIRNVFGRQLNNGVEDVTTTFSVGTDVFPPVLRRMSPINGQTGIGLTQRIVATFNEPIAPNSVLTTIQVQDATTNPPSNIVGANGSGITLERGGFDVVFTPDPCFGYPPLTTIQFLMQGENANVGQIPSPVADVFGNTWRRDDSLRWQFNNVTLLYNSPNGDYDEGDPTSFDPNLNPPAFTIPGTGLFRMTFVTKGVKPAPQGLIPGSPQLTQGAGALPCVSSLYLAPSCAAAGNVIFYTTNNGLGEIDLRQVITRFNQGVTDLGLLSVLDNTPQRMGRPGGLVIDPRWDPNPMPAPPVPPSYNPNDTFHTYIYLVDQRTQTVLVIDSRNLKTLGRFTGFNSPRDVTISTDLGRTSTTLWVSDFGSNQLIGLDLQTIAVDFSGQPGGSSPCDLIQDNQAHRTFIPTGRGPTGVASDSFLNSRIMVANTLADSVTLANPTSGQVINTYQVGETPVDCDWTIIGFGFIRACLIANQGGLDNPNGSIAMYINSPPITGPFFTPRFAGAGQVRDGIEALFTDNVKNPVAVHGNQQWLGGATSFPPNWLIPNTGGRTMTEYSLNFTGVFGISISPSVIQTYEVGPNPSSAVYDGYYPNGFIFCAVSGLGGVVGIDPGRPHAPSTNSVPGVRRLWTGFTH